MPLSCQHALCSSLRGSRLPQQHARLPRNSAFLTKRQIVGIAFGTVARHGQLDMRSFWGRAVASRIGQILNTVDFAYEG